MQIANYDRDTKKFTGLSVADESPLEPGQFLLPAWSTDILPPDFNPSTHVAHFSETSWIVSELEVPPVVAPVVKTERDITIEAIEAIEREQFNVLTPRLLREFYLEVSAALKLEDKPQTIALRSIEARLITERAKL